MRNLKLLIQLPFLRQKMLIEAVVLTGIARFAVLTLPFRWICKVFGSQMASTSETSVPSKCYRLQDISWAIEASSRRVPWNANCLAKAIAGTIMLRRRKAEGTVYFGVLKNESGGCEAHAWLRSGDVILTGAGGLKKFAVVSTFGFTPNT